MNDMRDEFAKAALQGLLSNSGVFCGEDRDWSEFCATLSEECYDLADAMMVARAKGVAKPKTPALDEYTAYDSWRPGDMLRVLEPNENNIPVGSLVTHDDRAGAFDPIVLYSGKRYAMASPQLEFVIRPYKL